MAKAIKTISTVLVSIDEPSQGIKRFVFKDEDNWELPAFLPGAHIDVHLKDGLIRTYSLCNEPSDNHRYIVAVKREENGRGGSQFMQGSSEKTENKAR